MKFRHKVYPYCLYKTDHHQLQFIDGEAETEDKQLIRILKKSPDIEAIEEEQVKKPPRKKGT